MEKIKIGKRFIGEEETCFIIAEAGVNHNGSIELAKDLIDIAVDSGADAVKFQLFDSKKLVTPQTEKAAYQKNATEEDETQYQMLQKLELSKEEFIELSDYAKKSEIVFLASPFDKESVDILEQIRVPAFKLASGEITNFPLLKHIAQKKKPVILSTGMATLGEVDDAISILVENGCDKIILLHCVTSYPAKMEEANLKAIETLKHCYKLPVGFSDHTPGIVASLAAVVMKSCVIEKHFTIDKTLKGPDHAASLDPSELGDLVQGIRDIESALGTGIKKPTPTEQKIRSFVRKKIVTNEDIVAGTHIKEYMLDVKRTGEETGIEPKYFEYIIEKKAKIDLKKNQAIEWNMIE